MNQTTGTTRHRSAATPKTHLDFLEGGGEMGQRMRALDWSRTPLGPALAWPQSLKTIVRVMLDSRYAMWMLWGPELTFFCNDAYLPTVGMKRDWVLGARSDKVWEEIWPDISPRIQRVLEEGRATWDEGLLLFLERSGFTEESYHTFSYSPIYDDGNRIAGMLCVVTEVTDRVIGERRLRVLRDLALSPRAEPLQPSVRRLIDVLAANPLDVAFASLYLLDQARQCFRLAHDFGNIPESLRPAHIPLADVDQVWCIGEVLRTGAPQLVELQAGVRAATAPLWPDAVTQALVLPIPPGPAPCTALLVMGVSPRRSFDDGYRAFFDLVARQISAAISDAQAYETERARAEALAEIDRAKTAFFSNVSHEFRTPLTLLLGPLEDALRTPAEGLRGASLDSAHRNALRLLRLVNTLLDFSRIESGRVQARYVATDLAVSTQELANVFESAIARAGLRYVIRCNALPQPVFVDQDMWEKIVLNLLSNAFKFTFEGEIRIELTATPSGAQLTVADTGTGIPPEALPQLFDRFYRVPGASGRTHEGSGIGLSLVRELVKLHGGSIEVKSEAGRGSAFRVMLPFGSAHLPAPQVAEGADGPSAVGNARAFVEEAQRWLPDSPDSQTGAVPEPGELLSPPATTVLLVDDNRDMREYVTRLLKPGFTVVSAEDGAQALELLDRGLTPDLVLADVMMPRLDGFGLLKALRQRPPTATTPVIFLSARAGEEARLEGLDGGADDYLVKPFSARELVARIETHIRLSRQRSAAAELIKASEERLRLAVEEAGMGTWDRDIRTGQTRWSRSHYELLGLPVPTDPAQLPDYQMWVDRIHPEDRESAQAALLRARDTRSLYSHEYRLVRADTGATRWVRALGRFLYDDSGNPLRSVGLVFDDTERKTAEIALREADERKDVFLATLAHELRNPLAPIRNAAQVLAAPNLETEKVQWAQSVIQRQVKHMAWLLDDLMDVARITQGKLELKQQRIALNTVVDSAVEASRPLFDSKSHQFTIRLPGEPVFLHADPVRLSQVLANLLTNAAKYTDAGGRISLSGEVHDGMLALSVKDNGMGITQASLRQIFTMFAQVQDALTRSEGGLGIGLALVRGLTELHHGTVEAVSAGLGHGSEFIVRLPIAAAEPTIQLAAQSQSAQAAARRVLIADDNKDAAHTLAMLLEMAGHDVRVVHDGRAALSLAHTFRPETAFLDIGMPILDGHQVAQALRREPWGAQIYLIALTGWGQEADRKLALEAGFDRHLTKPIDPDTLEALVRAPNSDSK